MTALSKIDMSEVTRLTKAGKLAEALWLLQGHNDSDLTPDLAQERSGSAENTKPYWPDVDVMPSSIPGGSRATRSQPRHASTGQSVPLANGLRDLIHRTHTLRGRLPKLRSIPGVSNDLGSARPPRPPLPNGARFEERIFSNEVGSRTYKVYVPTGYVGQPLPVVVMLHGCTQNPDDFATGTRMNELAEEQTFLVVYPRQPQSANMQKCWNWFNAGDQQRDAGEPSLIAGITLQTIEEFSADPTRVYVAGLSAGGAAAAIMAVTYPDLFAAVGVHSGLACGAASDMPSAFVAMGGRGLPRRRGGRTLPTIVFHGDADQTVNATNSDQVVAQASSKEETRKVVTRGKTGGTAYTRVVQIDDFGHGVIEQWILHGAGHAWSGGSTSGSYTDTRGPDASREMVRFFLTHAKAKPRSTIDSRGSGRGLD